MGRRLATPLLLFMLVLGSLAALPVAAASSTFQDPNGAYSFTLPDGWQADVPGVASFTNAVNRTTFLITAAPANGVALNDQMQQSIPLYAQLPGYEAGPGGLTDLTVGGQPAKGFSFHSNDLKDGHPLSEALIGVTNKDITYALYFETAREKEGTSGADVMTILTSWQFSATTQASPAQASWQGTWKTTFGTMQLTQSDTGVVGTYELKSGKITGQVSGNMFVGTWSQMPSYAPPADGGDFEFTLAADGQSFTGRYRYASDGDWFTTWTGTRS